MKSILYILLLSFGGTINASAFSDSAEAVLRIKADFEDINKQMTAGTDEFVFYRVSDVGKQYEKMWPKKPNAKALSEANTKLKKLGTDGKNCIFYFTYVYVGAGKNADALVKIIKNTITTDPQYKALNNKTSIFWVLKIDWRNPTEKKVKERNLIEFELKSDLDQACKKEIDKAIIASIKDKKASFQDDPDKALKFYVETIEKNLVNCEGAKNVDFVVPNVNCITQIDPIIGDLYSKIDADGDEKADGTNLSFCGCTYKPDWSGNTCCACACKYILKQAGVYPNKITTLQSLVDNKNLQGGLSNSGDFKIVKKYIDDVLVPSGKPILAGLHYNKSKNDNTPYNKNENGNVSAVMHFVVLVGKTYKNNKEYLRFYDVGSNLEKCGSEDNLLEINNNTIYASYKGYTYTLVEIRKN